MSVLSWLLLLLIPFILLAFTQKGSARRYYIRLVAEVFRRHMAVTPEKAKQLEDLGLARRSSQGNPFIDMLFGGMFRGNGKQDALEDMIKRHIVVLLPDGRVYLSEAKMKDEGF